MLTTFLSRRGRKETLLAATIVIVPTAGFLIGFYANELKEPITTYGIGIVSVVVCCYYLSAMFIGDLTVKGVVRHGDSLLGRALAWALSSNLLGVGLASLIFSLFKLSSLSEFWETFTVALWFSELLIGFYALLPMIAASIYYAKQLKKIKQLSLLEATVIP